MQDAELLVALRGGADGELDRLSDDAGLVAAALRRLEQVGHGAYPALRVPLDRLAANLGSVVPATQATCLLAVGAALREEHRSL